jgi:hypothetical protein
MLTGSGYRRLPFVLIVLALSIAGLVYAQTQISGGSTSTFPTTAVLGWADTSLSRDSAGVMDLGNGTAKDKSGTLNLSVVSASAGVITSGLVATVVAGSSFTTNGVFCAANGSAANPSVAACGASAAGMFSCATNASTGTCRVNTTVVTANSQIAITRNAADGGASQLNVTCNTTNVLPASAPILASKSAGASFTINLGTITTNPACFEYLIIN